MTAFQTYSAGQILTAAQMTTLQGYSTNIAIFNNTQTNGTSGGTNVAAAWTKSTLNTTLINNIVGCSIASSVITLTAGSYSVTASQPFYGVNNCKIRLRNTTASTTAIFGETDFTGAATGSSATLRGYLVLTGSTTFELQYWATTLSATVGLGVATSSGEGELYANIQIQQVA
jgi:hypothetical protein